MNNNHLTQICHHFNLGNPIDTPIRVYGGLLHIMWKVKTDKNPYAIKQISNDIDITDKKIAHNYNLSEEIANSFKAHEIPAISAIAKNHEYLFVIEKIGYLVYPWIEAKINKAPNESQALKIANILAKIHAINLKIPGIAETEFVVHEEAKIILLFEKAKLTNLSSILIANENYQEAIPHLKQHLVISHGDLDPKMSYGIP